MSDIEPRIKVDISVYATPSNFASLTAEQIEAFFRGITDLLDRCGTKPQVLVEKPKRPYKPRKE